MSVALEAINILLDEPTLRDINIARSIISKSPYTFVIVKKGNIIFTSRKEQIVSIISAIEDMKDSIEGSVVGCNMVGKAAAFLYRFSKTKGVYSVKGTKTGIALLIMSGIPCQIDEMIPKVVSDVDRRMCPFEDVINGSESSEEVYEIIKNKLKVG